VDWIKTGRERAKNGQWEGTAPSSKLDALAKKAAADGLDTNDFKALIAALGDPDPAERAGVAKLLIAAREAAVPPLIEAVADPYLGVRLGAGDLLAKLATNAPMMDPWQSPSELADTVAALRKWWADTGKLPPPGEPRMVDASTIASIHTAIDALRSGDGAKRTEAMSALVAHGMAALPALRAASKKYERENPRLLALIEDVRWSILVPDAVDRRAGGVRQSLARWSSTERQDAATRLGRAGRDAIPALAELANDSDPLVVENAVRTLSTVGGKDAIPAMAALLKASDSNLRMTAAQALGKTKSADATPHLLTVLSDENEIVACTALSALNEINSKEAFMNPAPGAKDTLSTNMVAALQKALADPRWRVRATAAEVTGKLHVNELSDELQKLLADPDAFVVKNTLVALNSTGGRPGAAQLAELAKRLPSLRGDAVEMLAATESAEAVTNVRSMYDGGDAEARLVILNTLGRLDSPGANNRTNDAWQPLISKAMVENEPRLRQAAAELIGRRQPKIAAQMIGPLLSDDDRDVRNTAAEIALSIIAGERRVASKFGINRYAADMEEIVYVNGVNTASRAGKTNKQPVSTEQLAAWHAALSKKSDADPGLSVAAALFATGDGKGDLPLLASTLEKLDDRGVRKLAASPALGLILAKLPWPEGKTVVEKFCATPALFALATVESERASAPVAEFLREPARFRASLERAKDEDLKGMLQQLLGGGTTVYGTQRKTWSLLGEPEKTKPLVTALLESTNAAWRGAALYAMGRWPGGADTNALEKALQETNGWVRGTAAQALARTLKDRATLEARLGPLVADEHGYPRRVAALALLEPEIRQTAGLQWQFDYFRYDDMQTGRSEGYSVSEARPLTPLETKPAYLESARKWLKATNAEVITPFALLLAQHGELDGVERLIEIRGELSDGKMQVLPDPLLTAIALTQNPKYIPLLRGLMDATANDYELRKVLRALKGMTGPEARQLRVEVNKRMRTAVPGMSLE
jgi:HEAT repeat protein